MSKRAQRGQVTCLGHTASKRQIKRVKHRSSCYLSSCLEPYPTITTQININSPGAGLVALSEKGEHGKEMGFQESLSDSSDHKGVCDPRGYVEPKWANTTMCTTQSCLLLALCLILLTLTEKIFAVCPVCMESSFLWCSGSHTIVCWSSEPEASKLQAE